MKVANNTLWNTLDLRRVLLKVVRPLTNDFHPALVTINTSHTGRYRGSWQRPTDRNKRLSTYRGCFISVPSDNVDPVLLALNAFDIFRFGSIQQRDLRPLTQRMHEVEWASASQYRIRKKDAKPKKSRKQLLDSTLRKLATDEKRWIRKQKLAITKLKGIRKKQKYYQKQLSKQEIGV